MNIKNISFKISENDYEEIKKFAKEKRHKNLKGYLIWLAKRDMEQPNFEFTDNDTKVEKIQKLQSLVEIQKQEIEKYKKTISKIKNAIDDYEKN